MFEDDFPVLDDSSGEAFGDGLAGSAVFNSGDEVDTSFDDTLQGSSLELGGDSSSDSVFDGGGLSLDSQYNLSGSSEAAYSDEFDTGESDTNGAGSGATVHPSSSSSPDGLTGILGSVAKFGASIGQLFALGSAPTQAVIATPPANVNPNRTLVHGISTSNAFLLVAVVVGIGALVALGGSN